MLLIWCAALTLAAMGLAGCSSSSGSVPKASPAAPAAMPASPKMAGMKKSDPAKGMVCTECSGKGMPKSITGAASVENGVQVLHIALKDGQYAPNVFVVKATMPVSASFEGTATGCLGHPMFTSPGKKTDVTKSSATVDLGTLATGTYKFTCAMGMNVGSITVQ